MKLLVFAHTPPPHHGQSYMVQLMLAGLGGDRRHPQDTKDTVPDVSGQGARSAVECYHVNARFSRSMEDVGEPRLGKLLLLFGHCMQAIWCRFRHNVTTLYYVPAPGKEAALLRDWLVMGLCRPFFKKIVFHWHATSMAKWLETRTSILTRRMTYRLLGQADLSIVLSQFNKSNAEKMWPRRIEIVVNGIPDPCPEFESVVLPLRKARMNARRKLLAGEALTEQERAEAGDEPNVLRVFFLAHCTREKGLFEALKGVLAANEQLRRENSPLSFKLIVAGTFANPEEKEEFERLCEGAPSGCVEYVGFLHGLKKKQTLIEADLFCFPSHWENQPVSVIEALAFGLPMVITRLPSVQEMLPNGYTGVADIGVPEQVAAALTGLVLYSDFELLRSHFTSHFTLQHYLSNLIRALKSVENGHP